MGFGPDGNGSVVTDGNLPDAVRRVGVRTMAEWLATGLSRWRFEKLVETGSLVRIRYGVYATAVTVKEAKRDPRLQHAVRATAARAATGRDSVASHQSAALLHGVALLGKPRPEQVTLTRSAGTRKGRPSGSGTVLHVADLPAGHVTACLGVPVTTVERTVADIARTTSFMSGVVSADHALHWDKTTKAEITKVLARYPHWPGAAKAKRVIEFADDRAESPLESCARVVFDQHGLPPPQLQAHLGGDRYIGRVDFYWPEYRTVAETDGDLKYRGQAEALAHLERDQLLRAAGFRVVHITWYQLFGEQDKIINWIHRAFRGEIS